MLTGAIQRYANFRGHFLSSQPLAVRYLSTIDQLEAYRTSWSVITLVRDTKRVLVHDM